MLKRLAGTLISRYAKDLFSKDITLESDAPFDPFEAHLSCTLDRPHVQPLQTIIPKETTLTGAIKSPHPVRIEGHFEGQISAPELTVGKTGTVKSHLNLKRATISGKVIGNLTIDGHLTLTSSAHVIGHIVAASISMEEGAIVSESITLETPLAAEA